MFFHPHPAKLPALLQHRDRRKCFNHNRATPCILQKSNSCASPLAACVAPRESRPFKDGVSFWFGLCFVVVVVWFFPLEDDVRKTQLLEQISDTNHLHHIKWFGGERGERSAQKYSKIRFVRKNNHWKWRYCFPTIWRSFSHCMEIFKMHPCVTWCLLAFCCCNFILIALCKDF